MIEESIAIAVRALAANKLRSSLTALGIIIGVGAVIALLAIGQGASAAIAQSYANLGTNVITVSSGSTSVGGVRSATGGAQTITLDDATALADPALSSLILAVAPQRNYFGQIIVNGLNTNARIIATTPSYQDVLDFYPASGDFFTDEENQQRALVAVLASTTAQLLFPDSDPIGQTIRVNGGGPNGGASVNLRVIGVMQAKGGTGFNNRDEGVFIPLATGQAKLNASRTATGAQQVNTISVKARTADDLPAAIDAITATLSARYPDSNAFSVVNVQDQVAAQQQSAATLTLLLGAIAGISLVVGGIGIMNIMIVSVTERTREIGIRKAVGAKQADILMQFLMEALVVSVVGGLLGILAGVGSAALIDGRSLNGQPLRTAIVPASIALAFGVSLLIGLFFGIYPASRAASLRPIDALRYE